MDKRLIDANTLHAKIMKDNDNDLSRKENIAQILLRIETEPTVEAEPIKHGYWIMNNPYGIKCCSECGYGQSTGAENYCPNCGAKMDVSESMFTDTFSQCGGCPDWDGDKCKSHGHGCEGGGPDNG